jgi:hypothetical protein
MPEFRAAEGAGFGDERAQIYGEHISHLEETHRGAPNLPDLIIDDARNPDSPLHDYFEWDDKKAADHWRKHQAQNLLVKIETKILLPDGRTSWTRAFHPVRIEFVETEPAPPQRIRIWTSKEQILQNAEFRAQIIARALRELQTWQNTYRQYQELDEVFRAIEQTIDAVPQA